MSRGATPRLRSWRKEFLDTGGHAAGPGFRFVPSLFKGHVPFGSVDAAHVADLVLTDSQRFGQCFLTVQYRLTILGLALLLLLPNDCRLRVTREPVSIDGVQQASANHYHRHAHTHKPTFGFQHSSLHLRRKASRIKNNATGFQPDHDVSQRGSDGRGVEKRPSILPLQLLISSMTLCKNFVSPSTAAQVSCPVNSSIRRSAQSQLSQQVIFSFPSNLHC